MFVRQRDRALRYLFVVLPILSAACSGPVGPVATASAVPNEPHSVEGNAGQSTPAPVPFDSGPYPWLDGSAGETSQIISVSTRFRAPEGFRRVELPPDSFQSWLRGLPLRTDRTEVLAYDGRALVRPSAAVILMDVGSRDLMQCADSLIRLHAEFLWGAGRAEEAGYKFTSGDLSRWSDWRDGERFVVSGRSVERKKGAARPDNHSSFRRWLDLVFTYAGTVSLARDTPVVADDEELRPGDFFVDPGFPGHAVIVLDIAENDRGDRVALIGQGFMPAEEVHVVRSSVALDGVWFPLPTSPGARLNTPSWSPFARSSARRYP